MQTLVYDGSFEGFLTAVFDVYEYKYDQVSVQPEAQRQDALFSTPHIVHTDEAKALRVWKDLESRVSAKALTALYRTFLSEQQGMEDILLLYMRYAFASKQNIEADFSHEAVLYVTNMNHKVHREKHRMEAFVRFQLTQDEIYYAGVEPDFNVLPLIKDHFEHRYADQRWMIYDLKRKYGIYYNLQKTEMVTIDFKAQTNNGASIDGLVTESEIPYQQLWKTYFDSVNIKARKNMKLHIKHMPRRYWKYLPEKYDTLL